MIREGWLPRGWEVFGTQERKRVQILVVVTKDGHKGGNLELTRNDKAGSISRQGSSNDQTARLS